MKLSLEQQKAYEKAAILCSKYEKCTYDIREKLTYWNLASEAQNEVITKLQEEKFIDDERYARSYVRDKFRFNNWGKQKISYMLKQKQIDGFVIQQALEEIDEDIYLEKLKKLLQEKEAKISAKNQYDKKAKLLRFAQSKGYESHLVYKLFSEKNQ